MNNKSERVTIMLDTSTAKHVREMQALMIKTQNTSVSFSKVLNMVLRCGLRQAPKKWLKK